jgi:signal transduction histidine kinase
MENEFKPGNFKILIVDDEEVNIHLMIAVLSRAGYQFDYATNGVKALEKLEETRYDLVLLDVMMPEMNGFDTCKILKENELTKDAVVIFITAKTDIESISNAFKAGAADFVSKPFNSKELLARVKTHLLIKQSMDIIKFQSDELMKSNEMKDKFISIIGHDLRNPIGTIASALSFIKDEYDSMGDEEKHSFIDTLHLSAQNAFELLEELFEWAKAKRGLCEYNPEDVNIKDLIADNISLLKGQAECKKIILDSSLAGNIVARADRKMVNTIIRNLTSNAIKFTYPEGKVTIYVREVNHGTDNIEIIVEDNGIGIPDEKIEDLFCINKKYRKNGTMNEEGSGLGLILCKEFAEKNHGDIKVESELGKGSRFIFTMPKAA